MRVFNIDISRKGISPVVQVTEYDAMSRFFTLVLRNGSSDYEPPENPTYSVWYKTNDSTGWYDTITLPDESTRPAVVADGNAYTVEIAEQATTSCGELALMINGDDGYQLTVSGIITRSDDIPGYDGAEVENYYNVYITRMQENAARAENAADIAVAYGATVEVDEAAQQLNITHHSDTEGGVGWLFGSAVTSEASGSVAAFPDGANDVAVKSLVATITPVQSGSGDPSPSNVRAISGRTGLTVTAAGKNLLNPSLTYGLLSTTIGALETDVSQSMRYGYTERFPSTEAVTFSAKSSDATMFNYAKILQYVDGVLVAQSGHIGITTTGFTSATMPARENSYCRMIIGASANDCGASIQGDAQVEVGSTATPYTPYVAPTTYPISWQTQAGTIYGGTLNVTTGVLTVDRIFRQCDANSDFGKGSATTFHEYFLRNSSAEQTGKSGTLYGADNIICSHAASLSAQSTTEVFTRLGGGQARIILPLTAAQNTLALFKTWLGEQVTAGTPVQFVYKLATPSAVYQLSPTEVRTLLGGNNIYTDAGAVSVEYVTDTKLYIDNKVAELQALILEN